MQNSGPGGADSMGRMSYALHSLNEGSISDDSEANIGGTSGYCGGSKRSADDAGLDQEPESIGISSDDEPCDKQEPPKKNPPPNGKKTKGRVKIKMEFIDNKLRRYTTFSKRKTGIMKKAYELSTLTGTQVMLLVASETGHVYTFATRKLQPMITSEAGKALIQTCLNSPDPPLGPSQQLDQRMSATGFEETDLTYSINEEEQKLTSNYSECPQKIAIPCSEISKLLKYDPSSPDYNSVPNSLCCALGNNMQLNESKVHAVYNSGSQIDSVNSGSQSAATSHTQCVPVTTLINSQTGASSKNANISMQIPAGGFATILAPGTLPAGAQLQLGTSNASQQSQQQSGQGQTLYRIPQSSIVSIPGVGQSASNQQGGGNDNHQSQNTVTMVPTTQQNLSVVSGNMVIPTTSNSIPGTVMYQTAQGVVYATPTTATLPEGVIFNFGQASVQLSQEQGSNPSSQQFITIPVPVSLTTANPQIMQQGLSPSSSSSSNSEPSTSPGVTDLSKSSSRK